MEIHLWAVILLVLSVGVGSKIWCIAALVVLLGREEKAGALVTGTQCLADSACCAYDYGHGAVLVYML